MRTTKHSRKCQSGLVGVKAYNRMLGRLIEKDKVKQSWIVWYEMPLEKAPKVHGIFDARKNGWTKVVLKPGT